MTPIIAWLLKSILCSGILYTYYLLFLKDKIFNKYNRFYLCAIVVASLILPFVHFSVGQDSYVANSSFQILTTVIANGGENFNGANYMADTNKISPITAGYLLYAIPSLILLLGFFFSIHSIYHLYKNNSRTSIKAVTIVTTDDAPGTPFSFFQYLFWNKNISLTSETGKKILSHELVHIQQHHSTDKLFLQIVQCIFWINPFIWIIKRELSIIHEFLADEQAVATGDTAAFADMMLQAAYAGQNFSISNHLTYSSIKRRIKMINKNKNPKMNYLSRIIAIPVIAGLVFVSSAYVANKKVDAEKEAMEQTQVTDATMSNSTAESKVATSSQLNQQEPIVVLLDAGHGGTDPGAKNLKTGAHEKDITLAIVKKIVELNKDENIKFILTRSGDETIGVKDRTQKVKEKVDLLVAIHVDDEPVKTQTEKSGLNIYVPMDEFKSANASKIFGYAMTDAFTGNYELPVSSKMLQRKVGIWMLQQFEVPSILIETGYMNNPKDITFLTSDKGVTSIANNVLNGIKSFVNNKAVATVDKNQSSFTFSGNGTGDIVVTGFKSDTDTKTRNEVVVNGYPTSRTNASGNKTPTTITITGKLGEEIAVTGYKKEANVNIHSKEDVVVNGYPSKKEDIRFEIAGEVLESDSYDNFKMTSVTKFNNSGGFPYLYIYLDGNKIEKTTLEKLSPSDISSISILKDAAAIKLYGAMAKEGVMLITSKKNEDALYVVDGVVTKKTAFSKIAPNDIQTINVIKDDKALKLYGEKGKKGVIEVTTKKGKPSKYQ